MDLKILLLALALVASGVGRVSAQETPDLGPAVSPELAAVLAEAAPDELVRAYASFGPTLDVAAHLERARALGREERRRFAIGLARDHADALQARGLTILDAAAERGAATDVRPLWINGVVSFRATAGVIAELAGLREIRAMHLDGTVAPEEALDATRAPGPDPAGAAALVAAARGGSTAVSPHLTTIRADEAWDLGYRGQGVLIAVVDGLFQWNHPDLISSLWINTDEIPANGVDDDGNGYVDDIVGWDFVNGDGNPYTSADISTDVLAHGTMVAGNIAGDGSSGMATGVAPDAQLMYLGALSTSVSDWWAAYQYAVDNGAQIISSSISRKWNETPDYASFRAATDVELLAGVLHVNSTGNQGGSSFYPVPFNVPTPGNCPAPWRASGQTAGGLSAVIGVGALSAWNSTVILPTSAVGPASWTKSDADAAYPGAALYPHAFSPYADYPWAGGAQPALRKPDVCAPSNAGTYTTVSDYQNGSPGVYYATWGGTSAAQPQVAGLAALLLSVDRDAPIETIARLILQGADDLGPAGIDDSYGSGRIDCVDSINLLVADQDRLSAADVLLMTDGVNAPSPISLHRAKRLPIYVHPVPGDGVPFPANLGNGAIEHVADTRHVLVGQGDAPYGLFLLDFAGGIGTPTSWHLGNGNGPITGIAYDAASRNAYFTSGTQFRVINGPVGPNSTIASQPAATPGILFTSGIAIEGSGNSFLGANQSVVYRFGVGQSGATPVVTSGGITSIAADRESGDFFINQIVFDEVYRYDRNGTLLETFVDPVDLDAPIAVEVQTGSGGALCVSKDLGATSQPIDNAIRALGAGVAFPAQLDTYGHLNLGDHAKLAHVNGTGYDNSFEVGSIFDNRIRGPWASLKGTANRRVTNSSCLPLFSFFGGEGLYGAFVSAEGTDDADVPPVATTSAASTIRNSFVYDPARPVLSFSLAFFSAEGTNQTVYNDFGGAYISFPDFSQHTLVHLDTFSTVSQTTDATCLVPNAPIMYGGVSIDLRTLGAPLVPGTEFTLTFYCGNGGDGSVSSAVLVDRVRFTPATFELRTEVVSPGVLRFAYDHATPGNLVVTFVAVDQPAVPRGSGPILGIGLNALNILQSPGAPFYTVPDASGSYDQTFGGIPSGFTIESCAVEFQLGVPTEFSNIAGPLFIF
ncbi:MAG: S8 family serine peptidase [Planctomycetota bacterium]